MRRVVALGTILVVELRERDGAAGGYASQVPALLGSQSARFGCCLSFLAHAGCLLCLCRRATSVVVAVVGGVVVLVVDSK